MNKRTVRLDSRHLRIRIPHADVYGNADKASKVARACDSPVDHILHSLRSLGGGLLEVIHQVGHVLVVLATSRWRGGAALVGLRQLLEVGKVVGAQLVDDARKQILQLLGLGVSTNDIRVRGNGRLHLGVVEVDNGAIVLEEVDLLNRRNVVHPKALEGVLQPLVIGRCCLVDRLLLPTHRTLTTRAHLRRHLCELFRVHDCCCCYCCCLLLPKAEAGCWILASTSR
mmetsp:Transcript_42671/g.112318  ORF Transcript_42671/g.112318 Transcript_42671/m.112318 type:complete len:227 (-) Transcript_42671:23-703(-)